MGRGGFRIGGLQDCQEKIISFALSVLSVLSRLDEWGFFSELVQKLGTKDRTWTTPGRSSDRFRGVTGGSFSRPFWHWQDFRSIVPLSSVRAAVFTLTIPSVLPFTGSMEGGRLLKGTPTGGVMCREIA